MRQASHLIILGSVCFILFGSCNNTGSGRDGPPDTIISTTDTIISTPDTIISTPDTIVSTPDSIILTTDTISTPPDPINWSHDTTKYLVIDTTGYGQIYESYARVKNLLHFHTKDTMITDSTYVATLYLGKDISSAELTLKVKDILEPAGKIKVTDTTQEISMYMEATLEDKAPEDNRDFTIKIVGGGSNRRKYDEKKNKMVWQWNVTPRKEGQHDLILSINHVTETGVELGSPETHRHSITIFSSKQKASVKNKVSGFFEKYWQWLLTAILLPVFIAWFTTRRKNAAARASASSTGPGNWRRKRRRP